MFATSNWLEVWARFRPDAEGIYDLASPSPTPNSAGRRWTYAQLHAESLAWARRLEAEGVGPGDRVALLAVNRAETLILLFACARRGAIFAPLNWRLAPAEIAWQLQDFTPKLLLADRVHGARLREVAGAAPVYDIDDGPGVGPGAEHSDPGSALSDPWVLMYTSGSSGKPKGALLTHQQLHWNALNTELACDLTAASSTLTFAPLFHTGGFNSLTTPLLHRGGRVVLVPALDVGQALALIEAEKITHLMGVPTIFQMIADHPAFDTTDLSSVRDAICGGAPLGMALLERYLGRDIPLRQGFGLTEVGPNCFSTPRYAVQTKHGTVGLPIHHIQARLLRPDGTECGPHEPGELVLSGPVVFGGYLNRPDATAESLRSGGFHTGDVLMRDEEGFFFVCGRIKEMYKSGGENVYPAEVEAAILEEPSVGQVVVIGVPDDRWGEVGCAFLEPAPGHTIDIDALQRFLAPRLARFKLPKHYRVMAALPRTGSGKIDRPALKASLS